MPTDTSPRGRATVTAFFESRGKAEAALLRLRRAGISTDEARLYEGEPEEAAAAQADRETRHKGFWETLGDLFLPNEDRGAFAEGLTRGGTLLSVPVGSAERSRVIDILDDEGTIDLDEREASWRGEGWGGPATAPVFGDPGLGTASVANTDLTAPAQDAGLRSGISGIGARRAGAPPANFARRDESVSRRRVRSDRWDEPAGEAMRQNEVEIEDKPVEGKADPARTGTAGRSEQDL